MKDDKKREKLRKAYAKISRDNKLEWCQRESRKLGMSYGKFCDWLGI